MARTALLSVSDKQGIETLARGLAQRGWRLVSTGGTAARLSAAGLAVTSVSELTGFPEIMDGRVKTLHPMIHGGLLGRPDRDEAVMATHGMAAIDLLVLNLYPFEETVAQADCSTEDAIEQIDIGGPAMLRAGAKNFQRVSVLTHPDQYPELLAALDRDGPSLSQRRAWAVTAFNHVARYDGAISNYLSALDDDDSMADFPGQWNQHYHKVADLRYGENPHQAAAYYRAPQPPPGTLAGFHQHQGKPLSYNNLADADAAWECVRRLPPACVIVKHANPCGVALGDTPLAAYDAAHATDPTSAFGGIIAFNQPLDETTVQAILERQFVEVLIAPDFTDTALAALASKPNLRVLAINPGEGFNAMDMKPVGGGLLLQTADNPGQLAALTADQCRVVSRRQPREGQWRDLLFAWQVAAMVKSNAIVYAREGRTLGIGAGQMSRVDAARIAAWKAADADLSLQGAVMASDAFFPFRDGIDTAAAAGIAAVIQPGGSRRDEEVIAAADEQNLLMVFTGIRHFRH